MIWEIFRWIFMTAAILVLAFWFSRTLGKRYGGPAPAGTGMLTAVEQLPLGQDKKILLLKAGKQLLLIGVTQSSIQFLTKLDGEPDGSAGGRDGSAGEEEEAAIWEEAGTVIVDGDEEERDE